MKVERVSSGVMTPTAARACFEAILRRHAIRHMAADEHMARLAAGLYVVDGKEVDSAELSR